MQVSLSLDGSFILVTRVIVSFSVFSSFRSGEEAFYATPGIVAVMTTFVFYSSRCCREMYEREIICNHDRETCLPEHVVSDSQAERHESLCTHPASKKKAIGCVLTPDYL